jgi:peptidoglycan/LPS O-acetylase OafA/YrhL
MAILNSDLARQQNNFDVIRLGAAFLVFYEHAFYIFTGNPIGFDIFRQIFSMSAAATGVCIFFIISGFLLSKSLAEKKPLWMYLLNRVVRIVPALVVVVILSILVFGFFISRLGFVDFISNKTTQLYGQNCLIYRTYYYLPGVFESNPGGASVNGSLWTIPYEFTCYLILPLFFLLPLLKNKYAMLVVFLACCIGIVGWEKEIYAITIPWIGITLKSFAVPFLYFMAGACYYRFRHWIRWGFWGILASVVILVLIKIEWIPRISLVFILPYLVLWLAFAKAFGLKVVSRYGDFSYGFYLFAFPVQQTVCYVWMDSLGFYALLGIAWIITMLLAIGSWYAIEQPAMRLKQRVYKKIEHRRASAG